MRTIRHLTLLLALLAAPAAAKPLTVSVGPLPAAKRDPFDSLSITRMWLYAAAYDALTFIDRDGQILPWLAERWSQEDPRTWIFSLRPGVNFSDGRPVTPASVIAVLDYLRGAGVVEPAAAYVANVAKAEQAGPNLLRLTTAAPDPTLPRKLSLVRIVALPPGVPFTRDNLIAGAIGSGPYAIRAWGAAKVDLHAVANAWRRAPSAELEAIALPDSTARRNALLGGVVDVAGSAFDFSELDSTEDRPFVLVEEKVPAVVGLAFNTTKEGPLRDPRVRRALISAVDADGIVRSIFGGRVPRATQPARHEFLGFDPAIAAPPYDPAKARALLAEAGFPRGFAMTMALTQGGTVWDQVFQAVASAFAKIGVTLEIQMVPEAVMAEMMASTGVKQDAFGSAYYAPTFDALDALRQHGCGVRVPWTCDPETERLRAAALSASDLPTRTAATQALVARFAQTDQALFLYESVSTVAHSPRLKDFRSDFSSIRYELMHIAE